eukprot:scaffold3939_cov166-Amphora_coffeaeformis.AAC.5
MAATTTSNQDDRQVYDELKGFLLSNRADLRRAATEAVQQVAASSDQDRLIQHEGLLLAICRNISYHDEDLVVAKNALQALVYMTSNGTLANQCIADLVEAKATSRLLEVLLTTPPTALAAQDEWRAVVNYGMALLANLTRTEEGSIELVGRTLPDEAVQTVDVDAATRVKPTLELLLARFLSAQYCQSDAEISEDHDWETSGVDPYQHFAGVLQNATQVEKGRQFLLKHHYTTDKEESTTLLQDLLPQLRSSNPIRRRGIAGVIRNICIDKDSSWWLLNIVQITPHLLYPLAGPEELDVDEKKGLHPDLWLEGPDKVREPDHWTRLFLVESILVLCASGRASRERLRLDRVYIILKWADMVEESEDVSEMINECVQYLRRDEEGTEEGSSDKFVADFYAKAIPQMLGRTKDDFDAVD